LRLSGRRGGVNTWNRLVFELTNRPFDVLFQMRGLEMESRRFSKYFSISGATQLLLSIKAMLKHQEHRTRNGRKAPEAHDRQFKQGRFRKPLRPELRAEGFSRLLTRAEKNRSPCTVARGKTRIGDYRLCRVTKCTARCFGVRETELVFGIRMRSM
jgi:hypothetical protein